MIKFLLNVNERFIQTVHSEKKIYANRRYPIFSRNIEVHICAINYPITIKKDN